MAAPCRSTATSPVRAGDSRRPPGAEESRLEPGENDPQVVQNALDAVTGQLKWCNESSGTLSATVNNGISLQSELYLAGDELRFDAGSVYATARYDLETGKCLNEPVDQVSSRIATAYYAYYPEYGQFTPLEHDLTDGRTLNYQVLYEGSRQAALAMLQPLKAGAAAPVPNWRLRWTRTPSAARDRLAPVAGAEVQRLRRRAQPAPGRRPGRRASLPYGHPPPGWLLSVGGETPGSAGQRWPGFRPPGTDPHLPQRRPDQLLRSQQIVSDKGTDYSARWTGFLQPTPCEELMLTYDVCEGSSLGSTTTL